MAFLFALVANDRRDVTVASRRQCRGSSVCWTFRGLVSDCPTLVACTLEFPPRIFVNVGVHN